MIASFFVTIQFTNIINQYIVFICETITSREIKEEEIIEGNNRIESLISCSQIYIYSKRQGVGGEIKFFSNPEIKQNFPPLITELACPF